MPLRVNEKQALKKLAQQYMSAATLPIQKETIGLWKALNRSKMQRPMVCIDQLPWNELNAGQELTCIVTEPYWRQVELELRKKLYQWNHFRVDMVLEPFIVIPQAIESTGYGLAAVVEHLALSEGSTAPAQHFTDVLTGEEDIAKITDMRFTVDTEQNEIRLQEANELFEGIAPVKMSHGRTFHLGVWDYLTMLMGIENAFIDILDRPEFIHACMERVTSSAIAGIEQANALRIHDDNANLCHCSYIYTDELLSEPGQGKGSVSQNCWAFGLAQLFTSASPKVTEEFELPYITRMAEHFGMIYYGCCDRLDDRLDIIKKIPHLKKVSCSPWSDRRNFAGQIGPKLIMSNKPTPAFLAAESVDWDAVKADLQMTVDVAKANNVNLELILKDISTVRMKPERLEKWAEIAMNIVKG